MSSQRYSELGESLRLNKQLIEEGRSLAAENTQLRDMNAELASIVKDLLQFWDVELIDRACAALAKAEKLK